MSENRKYKADIPSENDLLGMEPYCEALSKYIMTCETPMTISIQGNWGVGKTSAFRIMESKYLKEYSEKTDSQNQQPIVKVIHFDTWMYSNSSIDESMIYVLLAKFADEVDQGLNTRIKELAPFLGKAIKGTANILTGGNSEVIMDAFSNVLTHGRIDITGLSREIDRLKKDIREAIQKNQNYRYVVFVDDLDRLEPRIAVELLEGIKNFMDCPQCVFVLAVDESVILQGVKDKYPSVDDEKAKKFFDKIIQVPFYMPSNVYNVEQYVQSFLDEDEKANREMDYVWLVREYVEDNNPRNIKRVFNLYDLYKKIQNDQYDSDNRACLFLLILLQTNQKEFYQYLTMNPKLLMELNEKEKQKGSIYNEEESKLKTALRLLAHLEAKPEEDDMVEESVGQEEKENSEKELLEINLKNAERLTKVNSIFASLISNNVGNNMIGRKLSSCVYIGGFHELRSYLIDECKFKEEFSSEQEHTVVYRAPEDGENKYVVFNYRILKQITKGQAVTLGFYGPMQETKELLEKVFSASVRTELQARNKEYLVDDTIPIRITEKENYVRIYPVISAKNDRYLTELFRREKKLTYFE